MITYIFRKRVPAAYSIEKLFDTLYAAVERSGLRMHRLELPSISTGIVSVFRNAWFIAKQRRPGIIHITGDVHYAAILRPFSKTIITVHDCVLLRRGTGLKRWVFRLLWFSIPLRMASVVVFISDQTKREVQGILGLRLAWTEVIPNFVDPAFTPYPRTFAASAPRILHIGTTPNKNLPRVIAALRGIACRLVIVGPLSTTVRLQLEDCGIHYENAVDVDHASVLVLYHESDIVSFPSTYEGFGMPILEGQAVGRPVLTSNREPMRTVAGDGGALLVDPESVDAIRQGFKDLIGDRELRSSLILAGRENSRRYALDHVLIRYRALYERLETR